MRASGCQTPAVALGGRGALGGTIGRKRLGLRRPPPRRLRHQPIRGSRWAGSCIGQPFQQSRVASRIAEWNSTLMGGTFNVPCRDDDLAGAANDTERAERGEFDRGRAWALNEKEMVDWADLSDLHGVFARIGSHRRDLPRPSERAVRRCCGETPRHDDRLSAKHFKHRGYAPRGHFRGTRTVDSDGDLGTLPRSLCKGPAEASDS